jgi:hypothetical protein
MTNKERLISLLGNAPADPNTIDGALIDADVIGSDLYSIANKVSVRSAAIYVLEMLLSTPDTGNSDPAFSIKYDRVAIKKRIDDLKAETDESVGLPTIRGLNVW